MTKIHEKNHANMAIKLAVSPTRAAELIDVSRSKLYQMLAEGEIPCIKIGRLTRIPIASLQAWIDEQLTAQSEDRW